MPKVSFACPALVQKPIFLPGSFQLSLLCLLQPCQTRAVPLKSAKGHRLALRARVLVGGLAHFVLPRVTHLPFNARPVDLRAKDPQGEVGMSNGFPFWGGSVVSKRTSRVTHAQVLF